MSPGEILELLELEPEPPGRGFLERIFAAFVTRVPFESASKIVRVSRISEPSEGPVTADEFWSAHAELSAGGTCFSRTFALSSLLTDLGFRCAFRLGSIRKPRSHAGIVCDIDGERWLVDAGFPLPCVVRFADGEIDHPTTSISLSNGGRTVSFPGGPQADSVIRFDPDKPSAEEFRSAWVRSFSEPTTFSREVVLRRQEPRRVLRFQAGEIAILDAHSRTRLPLAADRAEKLSGIFGIDRDLIARALAFAGDPDAVQGRTTIEASAASDRGDELLARLGTPEGYRSFAAGLGEATIQTIGPSEFSIAVSAGATGQVVETVRREPDGSLTVVRSEGLSPTTWATRATAAGSLLVHGAELSGDRESFLTNDLPRGRIAGLLAMDLLALERL